MAARIRRDLERGDNRSSKKQSSTSACSRWPINKASAVPRAIVPGIRLQSPKITRKLTTEWFAKRVNDRYKNCLARGAPKPRT